jgi:hypothetical protein
MSKNCAGAHQLRCGREMPTPRKNGSASPSAVRVRKFTAAFAVRSSCKLV